ncbi:F0F1 ATP synthase subunit A [Brachybacterium sp. EF45031]|uniref:F0F1 ATP synthase subunit A n=1 Tax=Brachybacterium sillae TaxID=2810536 RepID=UPI00217EBE64|nr:F0F1 ATP synthase subunit A [Brachybacterium sillae]MCS6710918.1 F0F1 ATP synthase subunit A [Brachybacterium sillae]
MTTTAILPAPPGGATTRESDLNTVDDAVLLAEGEDTFFHVPSISEFYPPAILFDGTPFEFNRVQLVRLIVLLAVLLTMGIIASRARLVPGKAQSIVELMIEFVHKNIIENTLGLREGRRFAPMLITMFFAILAFNLAGVVPGLNLAGTSLIGMPLVLALWTFATYVIAGVRKHGVAGYLKHETMPPGVPKPIYLLLIPIEFLQVVLIRWGSLTIRLLANMVAGHIMLVVFIGITHALLFSGSWLMAIAPLSGALAIGIYGFEIFVAALQAFIFTMLSAVYIQMATSDEH